MAWIVCDLDGTENIFGGEPERNTKGKQWQVKYVEYQDTDFSVIELPKGSIKKLIGKELSWSDEPVELKGN